MGSCTLFFDAGESGEVVRGARDAEVDVALEDTGEEVDVGGDGGSGDVDVPELPTECDGERTLRVQLCEAFDLVVEGPRFTLAGTCGGEATIIDYADCDAEQIRVSDGTAGHFESLAYSGTSTWGVGARDDGSVLVQKIDGGVVVSTLDETTFTWPTSRLVSASVDEAGRLWAVGDVDHQESTRGILLALNPDATVFQQFRMEAIRSRLNWVSEAVGGKMLVAGKTGDSMHVSVVDNNCSPSVRECTPDREGKKIFAAANGFGGFGVAEGVILGPALEPVVVFGWTDTSEGGEPRAAYGRTETNEFEWPDGIDPPSRFTEVISVGGSTFVAGEERGQALLWSLDGSGPDARVLSSQPLGEGEVRGLSTDGVGLYILIDGPLGSVVVRQSELEF